MSTDHDTALAMAASWDGEDEPVCELCEYSPGAIYVHAEDCYDDEDGRPNLCSGTGVHETDCRGEWVPCPSCQEPERTDAAPVAAPGGAVGEG